MCCSQVDKAQWQHTARLLDEERGLHVCAKLLQCFLLPCLQVQTWVSSKHIQTYIYAYLKNTVPHRYSFYSRGCRWVVLRPMSVFLKVGCQYSTSAPSMLTTAHSKTKNLLFDVWVIIACFFHFINDVGATRHPSPHPGGTDGTAIAAPPDCHQRPGDDDEARVGESTAPQPPAAWRVP